MSKASLSYRIFAVLCVISIPFPLLVFPFISDLQARGLGGLITSILEGLGISLVFTDLSSDTVGLYALVLLNALLAIATSVFFYELVNRKISSAFTRKVVSVFLAVVLVRYGLDKLLLLQFPEPGPNLLYTALGEQDRDIVFWSLLGVSPIYVMVTGIIEIVCGAFLLFKRSHYSAALGSVLVCAHIVLLNVSFDISVKLFSSLLLLFALYLASPILKPLWKTLSGSKTPEVQEAKSAPKFRILKWVILILCVVEGTILLSNKFGNHRSIEMSAYEVVNKPATIQRIYFHADGFLILENTTKERFTIEILNRNRSELLVEIDDQVRKLHFLENGTQAILSNPFVEEQDLELQKLELENLSFTKNHFHWTVDELVRQ